MQTIDQMTAEANKSGAPCGYHGERSNWLIAATQHRDSDIMTRANFAAMQKLLGTRGVEIEGFSHWAVGWIEYLIVSPRAKVAIGKAEKALQALEDYPILDESLYSQMQWDEFLELAESELKNLGDNWREILVAETEKDEFCIGDDSSEWEAIEAARAALSKE